MKRLDTSIVRKPEERSHMATYAQSHQDLCPTCGDPTGRHGHDGRCMLCPCGWSGRLPDFMRPADLSRTQAALRQLLQTAIASSAGSRKYTVDGRRDASLTLPERTMMHRLVNDQRGRRGLEPVPLSAIIGAEAAVGGVKTLDEFALRCAELAVGWPDR